MHTMSDCDVSVGCHSSISLDLYVSSVAGVQHTYGETASALQDICQLDATI